MAAQNYEVHPQSNQLWIKDEAVHYIRHIVYVLNIPISRFPELWNCFSVLLLRRSLSTREFSSVRTLLPRFYRLTLIDQKVFNNAFEYSICEPDSYGFFRLWYTITDDSMHHKVNRHAAIRTAEEVEGDMQRWGYPTPVFRFMTIGVTAKGSVPNSDLNVSTMQKTVGVKIAAHYGGNVSDNATDAISEGVLTFLGVMAWLRMAAWTAPLTTLYGVIRLVCLFTDWFHIDNLIVTHTSKAAFGETDRDNHSEIHHRQLMESCHDVHFNNKTKSQAAMDVVLAGTGQSLHIQAPRERQQRWLVNQRWFSWLVYTAMKMKTADGTPAMLAWAIYMEAHSDKWVKRAAGEVVVMLLMPSILVACYFEAEVGQYFEVTSAWHSMPGSLCTRPGFRMFEIHSL